MRTVRTRMPKRPGDICLDYVDYEDGLFDNTTWGLNEIEMLKNYYYLYICNKQSFYLFQSDFIPRGSNCFSEKMSKRQPLREKLKLVMKA